MRGKTVEKIAADILKRLGKCKNTTIFFDKPSDFIQKVCTSDELRKLALMVRGKKALAKVRS